MAGILITLLLHPKDLQELISLLRLRQVHLHLREAVAAVQEVVVVGAVEVAQEADHRGVTKRFINE